MSLQTFAGIRFGGFLLDRSAGGLFRLDEDGSAVPLVLGSRALDVLCVLAGRRGELVTKQAIMDAVWPNTVVEDNNLTVQISALRRVLDQGRAEGSCIQTLPGRGYRLIGPAPEKDADRRGVGAIAALPEGALPRPGQGESPSPAAIGGVPPVPAAHDAVQSRRRRWLRPVGLLAGVAAAVAASLPVLHVRPPVGAAAVQVPLRPVAYSPQDRRQSIIVLPFENSSGDPTQDNLAAVLAREVHDGIAVDRTKPLVLAGAAAEYRGRTPDVRAIGRDNDVHFVLTGAARRQSGRLIVAATLYETDTARPVWSQRFDSPDSPDALDSLITNMRMDIVQATIDAEVARAAREHPDSLDKRDLMFAAKVTSLQPGSKTNMLARIALNERALALDPDYVWALREKALNLAVLVRCNYSSGREADLGRATKAADRALQLAPNDENVLRDKAVVLLVQGHLDEAAALLRKVVERATRWGWARRDLGVTLLMQGHYEEALENFVIAKRLVRVTDPESLAIVDASLALGLLVNDRVSDAIDQARLAIAEFPPETCSMGEVAWLTLIAAETASGHDAEARADLQKYLARPGSSRTIAAIQEAKLLPADPKLLAHVRQAGMPAE